MRKVEGCNYCDVPFMLFCTALSTKTKADMNFTQALSSAELRTGRLVPSFSASRCKSRDINKMSFIPHRNQHSRITCSFSVTPPAFVLVLDSILTATVTQSKQFVFYVIYVNKTLLSIDSALIEFGHLHV